MLHPQTRRPTASPSSSSPPPPPAGRVHHTHILSDIGPLSSV
jgi:hypothetical protein